MASLNADVIRDKQTICCQCIEYKDKNAWSDTSPYPSLKG